MNNKYKRVLNDLESSGRAKMKCFGHSMTPILKSGVTITFEVQEQYEIGDVVFSKVKGRYIDAHKIIQKDAAQGRYLIANNHGYQNGWTKKVFAKAVLVEYEDGTYRELK